MFVSLEPVQGCVLDAYPSDVQQRIAALEDGKNVFTNADCFAATVHRRHADCMWQTTPSIATKRAGTRDVRWLDETETSVPVYCTSRGWRFKPTDPTDQRRDLLVSESLRLPPVQFMWQWCTNTDLGSARNDQWCAYTPIDSATIESAFARGDASCTINVGLRQYAICFVVQGGVSLPYAQQVDQQRDRLRWARRAPCTEVLFDPPTDEVTCALCYEDFETTKHWPWMKTSCGHIFHSACFACLSTNLPVKCPMCRTLLESN